MKNKNKFLTFILIVLSFSFILQNIAASNTVVRWSRTWSNGFIDNGNDVAVDSSDNIYLVGKSHNYGGGSGDLVLVKYDNLGAEQWNRTWGGSEYDIGAGIVLDTSDNIYVAGSTVSFGEGSGDIVLLKYDDSGIKQWNYTWGGSGDETGWGLTLDSSGNIYVAGTTHSFGVGEGDLALIKFNSSGDVQWNRTWGGGALDTGNGVAIDSSGDIYVSGVTESFGAINRDLLLAKFNSSGDIQWNRTWGGVGLESGAGIVIDSSDNIYLTGYTKSFGTGFQSDIALIKFNSSGDIQWNRTWGGISDEFSGGLTIDSADNIYVSGTTLSFGEGNADIVLLKYDSIGVKQWNLTWGWTFYDWGNGVVIDSADNIYLSGYTDSTINFGSDLYDMVLIKFAEQEEQAIPGYASLLSVIIVSMISVIYFRKKNLRINNKT
ncbi:MAG: SBBP repeat-containing protein [Candidatus Lokiarchaeota archaeon]|nr:SBBP repeat-containing protein [Candidatus Lokiarchaeota archaeon]